MFLLVFCFFADKALSWCEIRQVLRMCTSSLLFRRAPPFLPRCCFLSSTFPSLYSSLVFYDALVFRSYLQVTLQPHTTLSPHPITHCLLTCWPCESYACSGCFESVLSNLIWICYLGYNFT